jgi:selenocysteine lyase/cysteine desulfurase
MITDDLEAKWRDETPGVANRVHLNNAGAALMPRPVDQAMVEYLAIERDIGGYEAADQQADEISLTYDRLAELVGAKSENMAIVANATDGFVRSMSSFDFERGDTILTSRADYTSYQIHYLALSQRLGVRVLHAEDLPEGGIDAGSVRDVLAREKCRLVHVSWIPTHAGTIQDVAAVGDVCEEAGVPYIVDACQAVGQVPIDVKRLKCDYLSVTARKFLRGPRGIGFMFASERALSRGDHPLFVDMRGARWVSPDRYEVDPSAKRYEDWEFPYALVLGLRAAAEYALDAGLERCGERARSHAAYLRNRLSEIPGARVLDRGRNLSAIVTVELEGRDARTIVQHLRTLGINTAATLQWYGMLDLGPRGVESAVRLSPHYYNTREELDLALAALSPQSQRPMR